MTIRMIPAATSPPTVALEDLELDEVGLIVPLPLLV